MSALHFHPLTVARVTPLTNEAVCVTLTVPQELHNTFAFTQGQYLTLRAPVDGQNIRRSYSICNDVQSYATNRTLQVGIKRVSGGAFSSWACSALKAGDTLQVMPPQGRFFTLLDAQQAKHYLGLAAGSGITPLLSLISTTLEAEPQSRFTLVYANRNVASVMFSEALEALKNRYLGRLQIIYLFSRQAQEIALFHGRLSGEKLHDLLQGALSNITFNEAFICGPAEMIESTQAALLAHGMQQTHLHSERFFSGEDKTAPRVKTETGKPEAAHKSITIVLDGKHHNVPLFDEQSVLDAALEAGLDLPYSCKGGVCCTCRAKVLEGKVSMQKNFTLEQWEIDKGFVLTCQSRVLSEQLTVSFDER